LALKKIEILASSRLTLPHDAVQPRQLVDVPLQATSAAAADLHAVSAGAVASHAVAVAAASMLRYPAHS
jgi:7,8-dihydro-6-hydroxymethylpterin-pyrophosphokinase